MRNIYKKNKKGFTILEVLFAIVILSFALSTIFVLLNSMFKVVSKVKKISINIDKTPIVFSLSPLLHSGKVQNYKSEIFSFPQYSKIDMFNQEDCAQFSTVFIGFTNEDNNTLQKQYFSNLFFIPFKTR